MHESYIRYSAEEKESIILTIKRSELSIVQALKRLGIPRRTFYNWYQKYATGGGMLLEKRLIGGRRHGTTFPTIFDK